MRLANECPRCNPITIEIASKLTPLTALKRLQESPQTPHLHVYLEGDGRPWGWQNKPADDPNSRSLTALKLMQVDTSESVYLNRPCYGAMPMASGCKHDLWTDKRYGEEVVTAMNAALDALQKTRANGTPLVLIGHSGGGTLAMLLAERREDVVAVVTLAANLDHVAWTRHFNYLPLTGSLNTTDVTLPKHVVRWHFAAEQDQQVPAELVEKAARQDPHARFIMLKGFSHSCCWMEIWPSVLQELNAQLL